MRSRQLYVGLAFAFLGMATTPLLAQPGRSREVALQNGWLFNYQQAKRIAAETNRPLMVVFRCVP